MIDLNKMINDSLKNLEEEKFVEKIIKEEIQSTLKNIIDNAFSSYSKFGKQLKEKVEESLKVDFSGLGLICYNELILSTIKTELNNLIQIQGVEKMKESVSGLLSEVKSEYNLSELIQELKERDYRDHDYDDKITLIIDNDDRYGSCVIYIDKDEDIDKYKCNYRISMDKEGKSYSIRVKDSEINAHYLIMKGLYGLDSLLLKIYASGAKIKLDEGNDPEEYEIYYNSED